MRLFRSWAPWVLALGVVAFATTATAATPYEAWSFDATKAKKKNDLDTLTSLTKRAPGFARIWFYGQVFDLATPEVPEAVKTSIRPQLQAVAEALAAAPASDATPLLFLDRVDSGVLTQQLPKARKMEADAVGAVRAGTPIGATLAAIEDPELAQWVFSTLLYRAHRASKRMGGQQEALVLRKTARRAAEGFALAFDDIEPWKTLKAWHGKPLPAEPSAIDDGIDRALDLYAEGKKAEARRLLDTVLANARRSRGQNLITALLLNGVANAAGWNGDRKAEKAARVKVLQAMRPLGKPAMVALATNLLVRLHTAEGSLRALLPYVAEMRALGPAVTQVAMHLRVLDAARLALIEGADTALSAGDLETAERTLAEARALATLLATPEAVARTTPARDVKTVQATRLAEQAETLRMESRIAQRRGRFTQARTALAQARATYAEQLDRPADAAAVAAEQARLAVALGEFESALAHAKVAGAAPAPVRVAQAHAAQGRVRLRQGRWAPAFAHANAGLAALREAGVADAHRALRAELHQLAGTTLIATDHVEPGLARLRDAVALAPADLELARTAAIAHVQHGQSDAALAALDGALKGPRAREAHVLRGCVQAHAGAFSAAIQTLTPVQSFTLPHLHAAGVEGRTCLVHALLSTNNLGQADRMLAPIRAEMAHPTADARLAWRVLALDGQLALARGDAPTAARRWRLALQRYDELAQERPERGFTADLASLGAPLRPTRLLQAGPEVFTRAAKAAKGDAREALLRTALAAALYQRAVATTPAGGALLEGDARPEAAEADFRAALGRVAELGRVLADAAVRQNDRVRLIKAQAEAVEAVARGRAELAKAAPAWTAYVAPRLPAPEALEPKADEALVVYAVGEAASHAWLAVAGKPTRVYALPGRAALEATLKPVFATLATPPKAWPAEPKRPKDPNKASWAALQAPVNTVLPFLRDAAGDLKGKTLRLVPDGPLVRLPFGALVLAPPLPEPVGAPPLFLGSAYTLRTHLHWAPVGPGGPAASKTLGVFGPLPEGTGCPKGPAGLDLCAGADQAGEADEIKTAFAVAPAAQAQVHGAAATPAGLNEALAHFGVVQVVSPVDTATGAILVAPSEGALGRLAGKPLALGGPAGARAVVLSRLSAPTPTDAAGLRALAAALRLRGVGQLLVVSTRTALDADRAGALAAYLAQGKDLATSLHTLQAFEAKASINPVEGGEAVHHPYRWGRWVLFE